MCVLCMCAVHVMYVCVYIHVSYLHGFHTVLNLVIVLIHQLLHALNLLLVLLELLLLLLNSLLVKHRAHGASRSSYTNVSKPIYI